MDLNFSVNKTIFDLPISNVTVEPVIVHNFDLALVLLAIIAFCQVVLVFSMVSRWVTAK